MTLLAGYVPGDTLVHRASAGLKFLFLLITGSAVLLLGHTWAALGGAVVVAMLYLLARIPARLVGRMLRPLLPLVALVVLFQGISAGWSTGGRVGLQITVAVLLGGLLVLTTRVSAMLAFFDQVLAPLGRWGIIRSPEQVALVLALTIRAIPLMARTLHRAREAAVARGLQRCPHQMIVPVIVSLIRSAEATGEAMMARGLD